MSTDSDQNASGDPEGGGGTAFITPTAPPATPPGENYEKRFKGLDAAYQKLQKKFETLEAERNALLAEKETLLQSDKSVKVQQEKLQADLQALQTEKTSLADQISGLLSQKERITLVMSEFNDLAPFEAKGLLPQASSAEEMKQKFEEFRQALSSTVQQSIQGKAQGSGPVAGSSGGQPPVLSKEQIYAQLVRRAGARTIQEREEYDALVKAWDEINK